MLNYEDTNCVEESLAGNPQSGHNVHNVTTHGWHPGRGGEGSCAQECQGLAKISAKLTVDLCNIRGLHSNKISADFVRRVLLHGGFTYTMPTCADSVRPIKQDDLLKSSLLHKA